MDKLEENKKIIFSLKNDVDGFGSIVLARLAFERDVDYYLVNNKSELETKIRRMIDDSSIYLYDQIFITGMPLLSPSYDLVSNCPYLSEHLRVFDHHQSTINANLNNLNFTDVKVNDNGHITCSSELFYNYLLENGYLERSKALDDFVELTRLEETWEWKNAGELGIKAHELDALLKSLALPTEYISFICNKIKEDKLDYELKTIEEDIIKDPSYDRVVKVVRSSVDKDRLLLKIANSIAS